ncbi:hypothetical protein Tco_1084989 [Tanacetum coccineum]
MHETFRCPIYLYDVGIKLCETPVEVDNNEMIEEEEEEEEEEVEQPKGCKKTSPVWIDFDELKLKKVDNASSNDNAIGFMKLILEKNDDCLLSGE